MHIKRVEEYSFSHGQHRELNTGNFLPLQPHQFGRPLTHDEMDYNMRYMEQTLGGYKIFGSNDDTSLSEDDIDKSLILHRITPQSEDYNRYIAGGYFADNELIWIPSCCGDSNSGQPCTIGVTALVSGQATQGSADANIIVFVTGLQGVPEFTINGSVVNYDSTNGNQYIFNGYAAGTYSITVVDTGIASYTCDDSVIVIITEEVNQCDGFAVSLQNQNSGSNVDLDPCSTFTINTDTQDSGGDIDGGSSNFICQDFQISLNLFKDELDQPTGEITLNIQTGNWGTLNVDYTTGKAFEPDTIWTSVDNVVDNGVGGYTLSSFPAGNLAIRVIESNNDCGDIEFITMPQIS